ncbi:MAG: L,D-transpeptidase [Lachnospiraceae bacterium]|nr:L,D-transpeptidase [Lachnospiraceae bacterium]
MIKKIMKILLRGAAFAVSLLLLGGLGYYLLLQHYSNTFPYGTWINGVYCTGLSVEDVNLLLCRQEYDAVIMIVDENGTEYALDCHDFVTDIDYTEAIEEIRVQTAPEQAFSKEEKEYEIKPKITVDEEGLTAYLAGVSPFAELEENYESKVSLEYTDTGYVLTLSGKETLDFELACERILEAVETAQTLFDLVETGCYSSESYNFSDRLLLNTYQQIEEYTENHRIVISADEGDYSLTELEPQDFLAKDEAGLPLLNETGSVYCDAEKVEDYFAEIASETSTRNDSWLFTTHDGEEVEVRKGTYGRVMTNAAACAEQLTELLDGPACDETVALEYTYYPESAIENDYGRAISGTYIEVDISGQHCYMYEDGELIWESDCVTGDAAKGRDTPTGVYYIEYKQKNRTLRGEDYETFVYYWMHFYNGCGFHDAYWRSSFGGEIYLTNGSHGCVNLPSASAKELYSLVSSGMTVIVY